MSGSDLVDSIMPPKKRQRTSQVAASKVASQNPDNVAHVAEGRLLLKEWVMEAYAGRHTAAETDKKKFPLGGSFLDIVQRCWADETSIIEDSVSVMKKMGIVKSEISDDEFMDKYLTTKDRVLFSLTYFFSS